MRTALACKYTQASRWTLQRAVACGELAAAGRQKRSLVFRREDLDRWMLGSYGAEHVERVSTPVRRETGSSSDAALARLATLKARLS